MTEQSIEERARAMGWVPPEEFRGKPENHKSPEDFVKMAETSLPHLKGTLNTLESQNAELRASIQEINRNFSEFVQFSRDAEARAYDRAMKELEAKQAQAKASGDLDAYVEASEELQQKIKEHPALTGKPTNVQPGQAGQQGGDAYQAWLTAEPGLEEKFQSENPWLKTDPEAFAYAQQMDQFLSNRDGMTKPRSFRLSEITRLVKERFPDKFGNPARRAAPSVEGDSGGSPSGGNGRSYNDLPPEAKKQCDKWTGKSGDGKGGAIPGLTREQFLKDFKWEKTYPGERG